MNRRVSYGKIWKRKEANRQGGIRLIRGAVRRIVGLVLLIAILAACLPAGSVFAAEAQGKPSAVPVAPGGPSGGVGAEVRLTEWMIRAAVLEMAFMLEVQLTLIRLSWEIRSFSDAVTSRSVVENAAALAKALLNIAGQEGLTLNMVKDAVYRVMINSGVSGATATKAAIAVREIIARMSWSL
ncbi:MAG TPA: hypothetical protein VGK74_22110 [Symbiobacteriaceae bacterium]